MKGIVFTELVDMMEDKFGIEMVNKVISQSNLKSGGVYSAVGTYDSEELEKLVKRLSEETKIPVPDLVHAYGKYFFSVLKNNYSNFFDKPNSFEVLKSIDSHIHVEVKKLYPDAELPKFDHIEEGNVLKLIYQSERGLSLFALGLIEKTIEHFKEDISIEHNVLSENGNKAEFVLTKNNE